MNKNILMIIGPNGAGKTTTALITLPDLMLNEFLNADEIAKGLAPLNPESVPLAASKLLIKRFKELITQNKSFAFETTGAGKNYINHLLEAKNKGYLIHVLFLWLESPELAVKRVEERVKQGGHSIPKDVIIRRYFLGLNNFFTHYLDIADTVLIANNSSEQQKVVARKNIHKPLEVLDKISWLKMQELAND